MLNESVINGRVGLTVSLTAENYEFLSDTCKKRGERSRVINEAIKQYRENVDNLFDSYKIEGVCEAYKLKLIPLLNHPYKEDVVFLIQQCHRMQIPCNQAYAEAAIESVFHYLKKSISAETVETELESTRGV